MLKYIMSLFKREKKVIKPPATRDVKQDEPDFIDYDGMGNQGRFPTREKRR